MFDSRTGTWLKLGSAFFLSALLALAVACATNSLSVPSTVPQATLPPSTNATVQPASAHPPRQHQGDHIAGLGDPIDAPHFIDSFPNHSQTLTQSPARVGVNFDISLAPTSTIVVEYNGKNLDVGKIEFDSRKIYMSAALPPGGSDGLYLVKYRACFANEDCSEGQIGYQVDAARVKNFVDLTGKKDVTIHLRDVTYQPNQIIITPGTTVTWVNDDPFEHFVNSDPHPSHNAFPKLNSLDIPPTKTFSYTFDEPGEYAFHCSAHVPQNMFGTILVREKVQSQVVPPTTILAPTAAALVQPTSTQTLIPPTRRPTTAASTKIRVVNPSATFPPPPTATPLPEKQKVPEANLPAQRFAAHFVSSSPEHADLLTTSPVKIQIGFNFKLAFNSNINVRKDEEKLTLGTMEFAENRLQMAVNLPNAGAGTYHVLYRACWPDKSCHDGEFAFVVAP